MRLRPLPQQKRPKREITDTEREIIEPLVEEMGKVWGKTGPPLSGLARAVLRSHTFMDIRRLSPFFPEVLGGKRLIDLGAGDPTHMATFALRCKVSEYVAVDRYVDYSHMPSSFSNITYVNDDMLKFLANQPDGSGNIAMLAIDDIVLAGTSTITEMLYRGMLLAQISRVVPEGGIAFGFNSDLLFELEKFGFRRLGRIPGHKIPDGFTHGGIFRKVA
jgi:hypothetical protein